MSLLFVNQDMLILHLNSFLTVGERLSAETLASQGLSFENLKKVVPQNNFFK